MTAAERIAKIEADVMDVSTWVRSNDVLWLLARLKRADELLREHAGDAHADDAIVIAADLARAREDGLAEAREMAAGILHHALLNARGDNNVKHLTAWLEAEIRAMQPDKKEQT